MWYRQGGEQGWWGGISNGELSSNIQNGSKGGQEVESNAIGRCGEEAVAYREATKVRAGCSAASHVDIKKLQCGRRWREGEGEERVLLFPITYRWGKHWSNTHQQESDMKNYSLEAQFRGSAWADSSLILARLRLLSSMSLWPVAVFHPHSHTVLATGSDCSVDAHISSFCTNTWVGSVLVQWLQVTWQSLSVCTALGYRSCKPCWAQSTAEFPYLQKPLQTHVSTVLEKNMLGHPDQQLAVMKEIRQQCKH